MRISTLFVAVAALGCQPRRHAEEVSEEAAEVVEEARTAETYGKPEEVAELARTRAKLAKDLEQMATWLEAFEDPEITPEAQAALAGLQERYLELSDRLRATGDDPEALAAIRDEADALARDVASFRRDLGS